MDALYVLIHSPLCGPLTWSLVAGQLRQRRIEVIVPTLHDADESDEPYWRQQAGSVAAALAAIPADRPLILIGHSGAGSLLPIIHRMTPHPVATYIFVDAGLPHGGTSRLDEMEATAPEFAARFRAMLEAGDRYPAWTDADLCPLIPDDRLRQGMIAELCPRSLPFWTEMFPPLLGWPDAPCAYLQCTTSYGASVAHAKREGWPFHAFDAGHFHMLVEPGAVADTLLALRDEVAARGPHDHPARSPRRASSSGSRTIPS